MNKRTATAEVISKFTQNTNGVTEDVFREQAMELAERLQKINHPPMPGWKKKLYVGLTLVGGFWCLMQYLHYEACREKFPQASGWVCMMQSR